MTHRIVPGLLSVIAILLGILALGPYIAPQAVRADSLAAAPLYFEPGVTTLRVPTGGEVMGKVVVDLRNGNVWGFPTGSKYPYPATLRNDPPTSHPVLLGHFDLAALQ